MVASSSMYLVAVAILWHSRSPSMPPTRPYGLPAWSRHVRRRRSICLWGIPGHCRSCLARPFCCPARFVQLCTHFVGSTFVHCHASSFRLGVVRLEWSGCSQRVLECQVCPCYPLRCADESGMFHPATKQTLTLQLTVA